VLEGLRLGEPWAFERIFRALAPVISAYLGAQGSAEPDHTDPGASGRGSPSGGSFGADAHDHGRGPGDTDQRAHESQVGGGTLP
jgi:hypothetical protein